MYHGLHLSIHQQAKCMGHRFSQLTSLPLIGLFRRTHDAHLMYTKLKINLHSTYVQCIHKVHSTYIRCIPNVHSTHIRRTFYVHLMYSQYTHLRQYDVHSYIECISMYIQRTVYVVRRTLYINSSYTYRTLVV